MEERKETGGEEKEGEEEEEKAWPQGRSPALPLSGTGRTDAALQ